MRSNHCGKSVWAALVFLAALLPSQAEEAVDQVGRRYHGQLVQEQQRWIFRDEKGNRLPVEKLAYVRFQPKAHLLPKVPLRKTLLLANQQRLTGALLHVDAKTVRFAPSWGKSYTLRREDVAGLEHADDWLPLVQDDRDAPLQAWKTEGEPMLDRRQTLCGPASIRLDKAGQRLSRTWSPMPGDQRISGYFRCTAEASALRWTIEVLEQTKRAEANPTLVIDHAGMRCVNVRANFGTLATTSAWHGLFIERQAGVLRFYVDDFCLGQTPFASDTAIVGVRLTTTKTQAAPAIMNKTGALWLEQFMVAQRLPALTMPKSEPPNDWLRLLHGEQLFGTIVSADAAAVVLEAKFGRRKLSWSKLRGIGFAATPAKPFAGAAEIQFRPAAGFTLDRVQAKLLRWEGENLLVEHPLLGELAIRRDGLDKIRFTVK